MRASLLLPSPCSSFLLARCYKVGAMKRSLQQIAEAVGARLIGDGRVEVSGVASIESASEDDLVFVEDEKHLSRGFAVPSRGGDRRRIRGIGVQAPGLCSSAIIPNSVSRARRAVLRDGVCGFAGQCPPDRGGSLLRRARPRRPCGRAGGSRRTGADRREHASGRRLRASAPA